MYFIDWRSKSLKQLAKIPDQNTRKALKDAVAGLAEFPNTPQVKKLTCHKYAYRLRVGRFRIFFDIAETIRIINIQEIKKRDDRTY
ncbi:MAG: type II toxin-antitoxin system RelE/ParE family toxin [Desulfovibrionales bacterium]|nr:MAG: type II toxin-antitoxin system RelE/ParE family toxin [Desulfovibrionales bacterium]